MPENGRGDFLTHTVYWRHCQMCGWILMAGIQVFIQNGKR